MTESKNDRLLGLNLWWFAIAAALVLISLNAYGWYVYGRRAEAAKTTYQERLNALTKPANTE